MDVFGCVLLFVYKKVQNAQKSVWWWGGGGLGVSPPSSWCWLPPHLVVSTHHALDVEELVAQHLALLLLALVVWAL